MEGLNIDRNEVLRYLGYKGQTPSESVNGIIHECISEAEQTAKPRFIYKIFNIIPRDEGLFLDGSIMGFKSTDIISHLHGAESCALMAVTLGHGIDTRIRYYEKADMTRAVIMDACATAAVEETCNRVCQLIQDKVKPMGKTLTSRFSPGYGDLPLVIQKDFISVLEADKAIGLTASSESILIPRKSVTAVVGMVDERNVSEGGSCINCSKFADCMYKRRDGSCGY